MTQDTIGHWDVWRAGSKTFAERVSLKGAPEPRAGESVHLVLSPPFWRIIDWERADDEGAAAVYKVWVKRTSS